MMTEQFLRLPDVRELFSIVEWIATFDLSSAGRLIGTKQFLLMPFLSECSEVTSPQVCQACNTLLD